MGTRDASRACPPRRLPPNQAPSAVMRSVVYATRRSPLALAQCRAFVASLRATDPSLDAREMQVVTSGDRIQDRPLFEVGGKGLFVKEIEEALLAGSADFAVHSMKDVPAVLPEGLVIACVPSRQDPRDALVAPRHGTLQALPFGARVGTSSLRRVVAIQAFRPDLRVASIRGNVDTRLRKVDQGDCEAVVLARAGLLRLGLESRATEVLPADLSLPAPGQGALGIECRADDVAVRALLALAHDGQAAVAVCAERAVLEALGGDCKTPLGAYAEKVGGSMRLRAFVAESDGTGTRRAERIVPWPADEEEARALGRELGRALAQSGSTRDQ